MSERSLTAYVVSVRHMSSQGPVQHVLKYSCFCKTGHLLMTTLVFGPSSSSRVGQGVSGRAVNELLSVRAKSNIFFIVSCWGNPYYGQGFHPFMWHRACPTRNSRYSRSQNIFVLKPFVQDPKPSYFSQPRLSCKTRTKSYFFVSPPPIVSES